MRHALNPSPWTERFVGLFILAALAALGWWIYQQQFRFNSGIPQAESPRPAAPEPVPNAADQSVSLTNFLPDGVSALTTPESFGPDTLSDKIDGRAELYLASGFVGLECQRFGSGTNAARWFEVFVYNMGGFRRAYAVFSAQQREGAKNSDVASFAYKTANSLFFVRGSNYVEVVGSDISKSLSDDMTAFARRFTAGPQIDESIPEIALFPTAGLVPRTISLQLADGFGFEALDHLFTAEYRLNETKLTGYLTLRPSAADAVALMKKYVEFLIANGGTEEAAGAEIPALRMINLFGTYEIVFTSNAIVAGVHQAENRDAAAEFARQLYDKLSKQKND